MKSVIQDHGDEDMMEVFFEGGYSFFNNDNPNNLIVSTLTY